GSNALVASEKVSPSQSLSRQFAKQFQFLCRIAVVPFNPLPYAPAARLMPPALHQIMQRADSNLLLAVSFFLKANVTELEQPELVGRKHRRVLQPVAQEVIAACYKAADVFPWTCYELSDLVEKLRRAKFIGIDEQDPRIAGRRVVKRPV